MPHKTIMWCGIRINYIIILFHPNVLCLPNSSFCNREQKNGYITSDVDGSRERTENKMLLSRRQRDLMCSVRKPYLLSFIHISSELRNKFHTSLGKSWMLKVEGEEFSSICKFFTGCYFHDIFSKFPRFSSLSLFRKKMF